MQDMVLSYQIYDTWTPGITANAESILFQIITGGDSTHNEQYTNMRGSGALPQSEKMTINKIKVQLDLILPKADLLLVYFNALLEIRVGDFSYIKLPVLQCIDHSAWGGTEVQASAADSIVVGPHGQGFTLDKPIFIDGAIPFKVRMVQGAALSAASRFKVILEGDYTLKTNG